jgi:hypothetical protein
MGEKSMQTPTELLVWAALAHLVADWMFQNDWMAIHKIDLRHPAAWTHAGIHTFFMWLIFPWTVALLIGITHLLIDTRKPVAWWMKVVKQTKPGPHYMMVEMGLDQVFHLVVLALVVLILYR